MSYRIESVAVQNACILGAKSHKVIRESDGRVMTSCLILRDAEQKRKSLIAADAVAIPSTLNLTANQSAMIRSRLAQMHLKSEDLSEVRFGTGIARSFSGRKPCVDYGETNTGNRFTCYDIDGYPLDLTNGTWEAVWRDA